MTEFTLHSPATETTTNFLSKQRGVSAALANDIPVSHLRARFDESQPRFARRLAKVKAIERFYMVETD
jgi:hypothetical protein